jgi:hypothetical protein
MFIIGELTGTASILMAAARCSGGNKKDGRMPIFFFLNGLCVSEEADAVTEKYFAVAGTD